MDMTDNMENRIKEAQDVCDALAIQGRKLTRSLAVLDKFLGKAPTNQDRADRAERVLREYCAVKGMDYENSSSTAADLIADLLHLVVRTDEGEEAVESTLRLARRHFEAEQDDPEEQ
jgi:hypothetical protein